MSRFKKFNKFGNYGLTQKAPLDNLTPYNWDARLAILNTAKMQLSELTNIKEILPKFRRDQLNKLNHAYKNQYGKLSEEQLRWLNNLYSDCIKCKTTTAPISTEILNSTRKLLGLK